MVVRLKDGVLVVVESTPEVVVVPKMVDLACQRALVTGEWYIPGHRLTGLRKEDPASMADVASSC